MKKILLLLIATCFLLIAETNTTKSDFVFDKESISVIDGDTLLLDIKLKDCPKVLCKKMYIRVKNVDTAEIHSKNENELKYANLAKEEFVNFIKDNDIIITNCKRDNYFRLDCDIKNSNNLDYADYIMSKQLGIKYTGLKKKYDWSQHEIK